MAATEHTVQNQSMAMIDSSYMQYRLDFQLLHQQVQYFLQGKMMVQEFDEKTNRTVTVLKKFGKELANDEGVQAILGYVTAIINNHTVTGNLERSDVDRLLYSMQRHLAQELCLNFKSWGVDANIRKHIVKTIVNMSQLALSRTIDNKERESYGASLEKVSSYLDGKKKGLFG